MSKRTMLFLSLGLLGLLGVSSAWSQTASTPVTSTNQAAYTVDPNHSYVLWRIDHFGFSHPSGKWYVNGTLVLDQLKPENSKANITIPIKSLDTGIPELDKHLKSPNFFDADKFPTATFTSNKVEVTGKNSAKIYGILTVHGISKPVMLEAVLNKAGENPITNKQTVGFSAQTQLKRSDFGITTLLPGLSDNVEIAIEVEGYK